MARGSKVLSALLRGAEEYRTRYHRALRAMWPGWQTVKVNMDVVTIVISIVVIALVVLVSIAAYILWAMGTSRGR